MSQNIEVHIHIHEGVSAEAARAAVEAATKSGASSATEVGERQDDAGLVERAYYESHGRMKPLLEALADKPDRLVPYTEVTELLGLPTSRSLPGLLGAYGRRAQHRYGGFWPFERVDQGGQMHLRMDEHTAEIIKAA